MWLSRRLRVVNSGACEKIANGIFVMRLCSILMDWEGGREGEREVIRCTLRCSTHIDSLEEVGISNGECGETISTQLDGGYLTDSSKQHFLK